MKTEKILGRDLTTYDIIKVWWSNRNLPKIMKNQDVIMALRPYKGPLSYLWPQGAAIVTFISGTSMTIDCSDYFEKIIPDREKTT